MRIDEHPSCYLSFVQVAGDIDVVRRGCTVQTVATPVMGQDISEDELKHTQLTKYTMNNFTCQHEIDNDYFTSCICNSNFCNHPNIPIPTISRPQIADPVYKQVLDEVNRSIRQLRSDIKQSLSEEIERALKCNSWLLCIFCKLFLIVQYHRWVKLFKLKWQRIFLTNL